jgi:hypothetical protein
MPTTSVRRRISRFNRSWGLLDHIWRQMAFGTVKARMSARAVSRWAATWQFVGQRVDDAVELGVHRLGVGLVIDAVQQRL